jgi:hypothetical protein
MSHRIYLYASSLAESSLSLASSTFSARELEELLDHDSEEACPVPEGDESWTVILIIMEATISQQVVLQGCYKTFHGRYKDVTRTLLANIDHIWLNINKICQKQQNAYQQNPGSSFSQNQKINATIRGGRGIGV